MGGELITEESQMPLKPLIKLRIAEYEARENKKFNREEAKEKLGLSYSHLAGVISGTQQTTPERLFILADLLGCRVDDLYKYEEE